MRLKARKRERERQRERERERERGRKKDRGKESEREGERWTLSGDLRRGTFVFTLHLFPHISVFLANAEIPFIDRNPSTVSARKSNIEKAVAFLVSDGVNLQSDPGKGWPF